MLCQKWTTSQTASVTDASKIVSPPMVARVSFFTALTRIRNQVRQIWQAHFESSAAFNTRDTSNEMTGECSRQ